MFFKLFFEVSKGTVRNNPTDIVATVFQGHCIWPHRLCTQSGAIFTLCTINGATCSVLGHNHSHLQPPQLGPCTLAFLSYSGSHMSTVDHFGESHAYLSWEYQCSCQELGSHTFLKLPVPGCIQSQSACQAREVRCEWQHPVKSKPREVKVQTGQSLTMYFHHYPTDKREKTWMHFQDAHIRVTDRDGSRAYKFCANNLVLRPGFLPQHVLLRAVYEHSPMETLNIQQTCSSRT